uniref:Uncharacterized protein n=1 Tax=Parascaris univalens TaxID=6257 RepID=A0A915C150_PARUN
MDMSRDLTCNETMSAMDEAEHKDVRRFLQQQTSISASRVAAVEQTNATQHSSRPILKTLMRTQTPQLVATNCSTPQKATHSSTMNAIPSNVPQSSYVPRCASKVVTIRASSSSTPSSHPLFKPYDFSQLSNPMAVMYQQLQQQQQHIQQQIVTPPQQLVSLSMSRTRECDDRASRSPSNSQANGGLDSRYYTQISVPRIRPIVSRSSNSAFSQQSYPSNAGALPNASLRMNLAARNTDPVDSSKNCSTTQAPIVAATSTAAQCTRYMPVNGYKPNGKGSMSLGNSSSSALPAPEKGDTKQQVASSRGMFGVGVLATTNASSSTALVLPQSGIAAAQNSAANSNVSTSGTASHAGPSPRPSILRKTRDSSSAASSAVRRLVMSDAPSSRPASCTSSFSSSPVQLDDASCSTNTKCISMGGEVRALSVAPLCNYEQRPGQLNESNARCLHSAFTENVATAFTRVEESPQRVSELDTPRKRLRKQQFDSSQASDKIKMEVSVHVDANKIDYQKEEISLWRLAPTTQIIERAPVPHSGMIEKGTKRRGRPRADARASNEPTATSSASPVNSTILATCAPPRTKKARKSQAAFGVSEANAAREGFIVEERISLDRRYAGSANFASELPKRRLRVKAPRNTKSKKAALATNETAEAETAAKTLSSLFQEIQRKKNDGSSAREKPRLCDLIDDNEMDKVDERTRIEVDCPVETEDACSFSSDISDVSLDFESGDRARNISVVSSKSSKMRDLALDNLHGDQTRPLYKPRPRLLSGYNVPANTMLSHIERPECTEAILEKVRMMKAAKNSLRKMQRSVRERNTAQRVQLKRELFNQFHEVDRECSAPNLVDASSVQKMTGVSTSELCVSTTGFYKMLSRICSARHGSHEESSSGEAAERSPPIHCVSPLLQGAVPTPTYAHIECGTLHENSISPSVLSRKAITQSSSTESTIPMRWSANSEFAAVADVLAFIIDRVVDWTDGNGGRCEGISGKVKKKRRRRTMRGVYIVDSASSEPALERLDQRNDTSDKEWYPQMQQPECGTSKVKRRGEGRKRNERHKVHMLNGQCGEEQIDDQLREINIALKDLNRKDYSSHSFTPDPAILFNATYERLLRLERVELENEANTMELMLDFLQVTNKQAYDQLMDDIERDYDSDDDESTREMKRRRRIVAFSVQVPRANPSLPKRDLYNPNRSTNFHPTTADINELFGFGSSYYRGHLSANNDKAYVYLDRKGNRVKERFDVHRFKEYEFVPDAELDDMPFNLTAEVLRNEYESKLGLMLTQYRYDDAENNTSSRSDEKCKASLLVKSFDKLKIHERRRHKGRKCVVRQLQSGGLTIKERQHRAADGRHFSASEVVQQREAIGNGAQLSSVIVKEEEDDIQVIGEKVVDDGVELSDAERDDAAAVKLCEEPGISSGTESDVAQCESKPALTETDRLQLARRADNIREMFATLLHTLRINSYLASTATEVFSEHAKEILSRSSQPSTSPDERSKGSNSCAVVGGFSKERS